MATILGINYIGHDSSASIIKDNNLVAAVEEERFARKKHTGAFPLNSIKYCLEEAHIDFSGVDYVGFYVDPKKIFSSKLFKSFFSTALFTRLVYLFECSDFGLRRRLIKHFGFDRRRQKIIFIDHHLAHASSAFFLSPFDKAAILTMDGIGEWDSGIFAVGERNSIKVLKEISFPNSIGYLYSAVTRYLGFMVNSDEYKVMGLASFGNNSKYYDYMKEVVRLMDDGTYVIDTGFLNFQLTWGHVSRKFSKIFGPARGGGEKIDQRHKDIAWALQKVTETTGLHMANFLHKQTGLENICLAGGVALNCVMNGRILRETSFKNIFIQPASYDAGTSLGCALYINHAVLNSGLRTAMNNADLGPEYGSDEIEAALKGKQMHYRKADNLEKEVAALLAEGLIVGWFQGRAEFGPRALGYRSILADPTRKDMQDIVNTKVKHREEFRPFAPSVIKEKCAEYFDISQDSPFMLLVSQVHPRKHELLPAITHTDGSARVHTVRRESNPRYWKLLAEFEKLKGVPVLLNTSFNINKEAMVMSPADAVKCFQSTDIDILAIGDFIAEK